MTNTNPQPRPARITGLAHLLAALGYSIGGLRRLWAETAFRLEVAGGAAGLVLFALGGAGLADYVLFGVLFSVLIAVEALNTAIEELVDHLSPDWSVFARNAKDLGSLAVFCLLVANGLFAASVALRLTTG